MKIADLKKAQELFNRISFYELKINEFKGWLSKKHCRLFISFNDNFSNFAVERSYGDNDVALSEEITNDLNRLAEKMLSFYEAQKKILEKELEAI